MSLMSDGLNADRDDSASRARVAVIGLGAMGLPMARRLASALEVTVYDIDIRRAEAVGDVAKTAASAREAVVGAGVVLLVVRTLAQADASLFGNDGVLEALEPGKSVVALASTVGVAGARALGERLAEYGVHLLDMPISGGPARAAVGDLLVFVGAPHQAIDAARQVLDLLASRVCVVGACPGDGQALKTVNQLLCGVHIAATAEALALADGLGLDAAATLDALSAGAAASFMLADRGPRVIEVLQGNVPEVVSRVDIFVKDLGIVADAGRRAHVALPVATVAEQLFRLAEAAGLGAADDSSITTLLTSCGTMATAGQATR